MEEIEHLLSGGHPNSLGNTVQVVEMILADPSKFDLLFNTYFSKDKVVRLRVSNAMKRICKANKSLLVPYIDRFLDEIALIDQASTQWTLAQLFLMLEKELNDSQKKKATGLLKRNIASQDDWIVLNMTMETLGQWAEGEEKLKSFVLPHLNRLKKDKRKSVASKANKVLARLG
ncbi:hypothetical protein [Poritiphilus flavus]|uniref:Uncharacterized protein n=1 Tax=Poritiphilus flavus TaxID=2697053 RepID=A0A6L9E8V4_9FLAO|nr:hypothetical protein [Poritiphilus flavus]NAS11021.1 hypothetical protein [Poritiphilus flavus]